MNGNYLEKIDFIAARLDEAEVIARKTTGNGVSWQKNGRRELRTRPDDGTFPWRLLVENPTANVNYPWADDLAHMALHDPVAVLADAKAKRRTLDRARRYELLGGPTAKELFPWLSSAELGDERAEADLALANDMVRMAYRDVLDDMVMAWPDHPDFRPIWRLP